jgi:DNA-binding NarL/FixJ family response regulator
MSAQQDHDSVVKALNLGALGFIPKSAPRKVILGALQLINSGGVYIPPQALSRRNLRSLRQRRRYPRARQKRRRAISLRLRRLTLD